MEHMRPKVFVSYSTKDAARADALVQMLEDKGFPCWISFRDMRAGHRHTAVIPKMIRQCPFFLILLSQSSIKSPDVDAELQLAHNHNRHIIPLPLDADLPDDAYEYLLSCCHRLPYFDSFEKAVSVVISALNAPLVQAADSLPQDPLILPTAEESAPEEFSPEEKYMKANAFFKLKLFDAAKALYQEAADSGYVNAQCEIGHLYRKGLCNFPKDGKKAFSSYLPAAHAGNPDAQYWVAFYYLCGTVVPQDLQEAKRWYQLAANQGHPTAMQDLQLLNSNC